MKSSLKLTEADYNEICEKLEIDPESDFIATNVLSNKLDGKKVKKSLKKLRSILTNKIVLIFGAGPSLSDSIEKIYPMIVNNREKFAIIAIDGVTQALLEKDIIADIIISDLDGGLNSLIKSHQKGSLLVLHGHGDNIIKINELDDFLRNQNIIGSTQIKETSKVKNFGGFTDGDRGVYLAASFHVKMLLLIAFDFGNIVGRFSKPTEYKTDFPASEKKLIKFSIAKKLLQKLLELKPNINIFSFENHIESIKDIRIISIEQLKKEIL